MAVTTKIPIPGQSAEWQEGFVKFKSATYKAGLNTDLASVGLEEGDDFAPDTTYEIISARNETARNGDRLIVVTGMKEVTV